MLLARGLSDALSETTRAAPCANIGRAWPGFPRAVGSVGARPVRSL